MAIPNHHSVPYQWGPDLMARVIDAVALINRSKPDVLTMFRGCGIPPELFVDVEATYNSDRAGTKKAWIARTVIERINVSEGDRYLGYRRAVLQRVIDFEDFAQLWPSDQDRARGVVAAVRESENAQLMREGGANGVVVSSEAAGRLLGVAASSPTTGAVFEDLLVPGAGLELTERDVLREEVGLTPRATRDLVVAIIRDGQTHMFTTAQDVKLRRTDRVVVVRGADTAR